MDETTPTSPSVAIPYSVREGDELAIMGVHSTQPGEHVTIRRRRTGRFAWLPWRRFETIHVGVGAVVRKGDKLFVSWE